MAAWVLALFIDMGWAQEMLTAQGAMPRVTASRSHQYEGKCQQNSLPLSLKADRTGPDACNGVDVQYDP